MKSQTHKRRRADKLVRKSQFVGSLYVQESTFAKSADCVLQLTKGIVMKCKVCKQQNQIAVDLSKKVEPLTRTIAPMDMNTHIM